MRVAVAGGTGVVGGFVVEALRAAGQEPVVLARSVGVDLTTGAGLDEALRDVPVVIDVSNNAAVGRKRAVEFFEAATGNLLRAGERAGVRHHVALSIVGIDRVGFGYYIGKRRQEELVQAGPVPASVLRATQFHEFPGQVLRQLRGPVAFVPSMRSQPVAAREVAGALVELALGEPVGMAPEIAGPEVLLVPDMARRLLRATGSRRWVVPVRLPGAVGKGMSGGALLPTGPGPRGKQTFDEWLAETARKSR
jgi:uncharacterized protein YbjT (DUF2867 family)